MRTIMGVFLLVFMCAAPGFGEGDCAGCSDPAFPQAAAFLAEKGYPSGQYTVLLCWREAARNGETELVTGYHVLPVDGTVAFDLYANAKGDLLDSAGLKDLGIRAKNWDLRALEQPGEVPLASKAGSRTTRTGPTGPTGPGLGPSIVVQLPALDVAALKDEDGDPARKGPRRVGVVREISEPIRTGAWQAISGGGNLWAVTFQSPDAHAIRVHFAELSMPAGAQVVVYNARNPAESYGPYRRPYGDEAGVWSASCFSDTVTVECVCKPGTNLSEVKLVIDALVHTYDDLGTMQWAKAFIPGPCHQDVSCFDDWAAVARGVAGFTFVSRLDQLTCSGTLIADTEPDSQIPYFLTASHCVSLQTGSSGAASMEFYWLYQTPSCDGMPPAISDVPRTSGGADLLATVSSATGSDFCLARLRAMPPDGLTYAGWSTEIPAAGTHVVVIHHPQGDYKRISFGSLTDTGSPQNGNKPIKPIEFFHEVHYSLGSTEPASSGGPLFLEDRQLLIGQLWGGYASCDKPEEPDYYGRFDKSFPIIEPWLVPSSNPYDVDGSGEINSADVQMVVNAALGISIRYNADVDHSGAVDAVDVQLVILALLRSLNH